MRILESKVHWLTTDTAHTLRCEYLLLIPVSYTHLREVPLTNDSPEWDEIVKEYGEIRKTFDCELCNHIMLDLLEELENRSKERGAKNEQKPCLLYTSRCV